MARDSDALLTRFKWASAGDVAPPSDFGITRSEGFGSAFDPGGSEYPERPLFNQMFRELYGLAKEINEGGVLLEWSDQVDYVQHARIRGSDGEIYRAIIPNGPTRGNSLDPTTKTDDAIWAESDVTVDTSGFLTSSSLAAQLGEYVTETELNSDLASYATRAYLDGEIDDLVDGAPNNRNTLGELSDAIDGRASSGHTHSQYAGNTHVHSSNALLDSPVFTGTPEAPSPSSNDDSDRIATTAWAQDEFAQRSHGHSYASTSHTHSQYALLDSPVFTGTPEAPSPSSNDDSDRIATTAWAQDEFAQRSHGHSYASTNHTHSQYATSGHSHSQYATSGHSHSQYLTSLPSHSHGSGDLPASAFANNYASGISVGNTVSGNNVVRTITISRSGLSSISTTFTDTS